MEYTLDILKLAGATLGIAAFSWQVYDLWSSYLHIHLRLEVFAPTHVLAHAEVENKTHRDKKIDNAVVLVGPESDPDPMGTYDAIMKHNNLDKSASNTNMIAETSVRRTLHGPEGRQLIPVGFYYSENIKIGDETLSYTVPINTKSMTAGMPYSVRFFVVGEGKFHRSTHRAFVPLQDDVNKPV